MIRNKIKKCRYTYFCKPTSATARLNSREMSTIKFGLTKNRETPARMDKFGSPAEAGGKEEGRSSPDYPQPAALMEL
jgi:hypothetical protein